MLNRLAAEMAAEIASHDWSDAPYRLDRAGHQRAIDSPKRRTRDVLSPDQTDYLRTNVMWVTAQVLKHADPNLDLHEYAAACGVPRSITHRSNGSPSDAIVYGVRWNPTDDSSVQKPGAPLWRARLHCSVANLVVFKRLLAHTVATDPSLPDPEVESIGSTLREVTIVVRGYTQGIAAERAVELVGDASLSVADGTPAVLMAIAPFEG